MRTLVVGQPHDHLTKTIQALPLVSKRDEIVFQHRTSSEKRLEFFLDLKKYLQEIEFIVCQEKKQTKDQYHKQLLTPKVAFSANMQETLGIGVCIEAPLFKIIPFAPNRLSYAEIFKNYPEFLYPSEWTENWESYLNHREELIQRIQFRFRHYESFVPIIEHYCQHALPKYASGIKMIDYILG